MSALSSTLIFLYIVVFIVALVASASFIYHWKKYGMNSKAIRSATAVYCICVGALLLVAGILLIFIVS